MSCYISKKIKRVEVLRSYIVKMIAYLLAAAACILSCIPLLLLVVGTVTGNYELAAYLEGTLWGEGGTYLLVFPSYPTLGGMMEVLFKEPEFYVVFWNSVELTGCIVLGQILFAVPAAWGFSRWHGRWSSLLFYLYTILMLLPFQVTMLSNYIVIDGLGILDTHAAVILPAVFSTFPVFIIYRSFLGIPEEIYEAFSLDSSSHWRMFCHVGVPLALPGIKSAALLGIIEYWNMVEQPLLFLKTPSRWPFSLYIPGISYNNVQYIFACSLIVLTPMVLIMFWGKDDIRKGIGNMAVKP